MTNWSEGYVSDIDYIYGYYEELNPARLTIPFLAAGLAIPEISNACELGFGQGISVNIHAAAGTARWYATDFNPSHAAYAEELAAITGTKNSTANLSEQGFNEFCRREDLPDFDFIGLHGIWSWISDENRHIIVDFLRRKLKPGGVLYVSYNTLPGWSAQAPIRHLLSEYSKIMGSGAHSRHDNILQAIRFGEEVFKNSPRLTQSAPHIEEYLKDLVNKDSAYLVHEYLNQDWHPMYFSQMEEWLKPAKLAYACSARITENFQSCLYNEAQTAFMESIGNPSFAETIKDYIINQRFRCDYWVKGKRSLNRLELEQQWRKLRVMLLTDREKYNPTLIGARAIDILPEITDPVLDALADGKIHTVAALQESLATTMDKERLYLALALLFTKGDLVLCATDEQIAARRETCRRYNQHLLEQSVTDIKLSYLASPLTGGGVVLNYVEKLYLLAHQRGLPPTQWPPFIWSILASQGRKMLKDGIALEDEEANLAEIRAQQEDFMANRFPIVEKLQCLA